MAKKPCGVTYNGKEFTRDQFMAYLLQDKSLDNYVYGADVTNGIRPAAVKDVQKINYTTQNGNQRVVYNNGLLKVVNAKTGEEVSAPTKRKAIREAADNYDFTQGDNSTEIPADATTDKEVGMHIVNTSNNPAELVSLWQMQEPVPEALSSVESAIAEFGQFTTTNASYNRFGDRNNMTRGKALNYVSNTQGAGIDQIAKEISDHTGVDVQPQDIVDFMDRFPGGVQQAMRPKPTDVANETAAKFEQLTGFPLTKDIAEKVMAQFESKMDEESRKAYEEALQKEYDNEQQLTAELDRLIADGSIKLPEEAANNVPEANSGNEAPAKQNEPGQNLQGQEPSAAAEAVPLKELSPEEQRLQDLVDKISDLQLKIEKADAAKETLRKQGKENSDEFKIKYKAWQQLTAKIREAEKEFKVVSAKIWADKLRQGKIKSQGIAMSNPFQIPVAIYNAAVETIATAIEGGAHLRNAIQSGVDFINERFQERWDESAFRERMGQDLEFPFTPSELRAQQSKGLILSQKNKQIADALVEEVRNNKHSKVDVLRIINESSLSPTAKEVISKYVNKNIIENVFKLEGKGLSDKYLNENNGDAASAIEDLGRNYDTQVLNANSDVERENLKQRYIQALAYLKTEKIRQRTQSGEIKPASILRRPEDNEVNLPKQTFAQRLNQKKQDKYARVAQLQQEVSKVKEITSQNDALTAFRLANPKAWAKISEILDWVGSETMAKGTFFDRLKKAGIDLKQLGLYMYAQHATERNAANAKTRYNAIQGKIASLEEKLSNAKGEETKRSIERQIEDIENGKNPDYIDMPDGGSGMTNQEAQDILSEVDKDGKTEQYEQFAKEFRDNVVDKILDFKLDSGIISQQEYNAARDAYKNYVPLKFDVEVAKRLLDNNEGKTQKEIDEAVEDNKLNAERKRGKDLYRSTGAAEVKWSDRNNPILQTIQDLIYSVQSAELNKANITLANLVRDANNPGIAKVEKAQYDIQTDAKGDVVYSQEIYAPKDGIPFYEDGKKSYIVPVDPALKDTFKKIPPTILLKIGQNTTSFFRTFATLTNLSFIFTNPFRDTGDAATYLANKHPEIAKEFVKNIKEDPKIVRDLVRQKGEYYDLMKRWEKAGGKVTFLKDNGIEQNAEKINKLFENYDKPISSSTLSNIKNELAKKIEVLEFATRLLVFKSALESGKNDEEAALISRDATIDFEKSGIDGPYINAWKAFGNANIQGVKRLGDLAKSARGRKIMAIMAIGGFIEAALNDALNGDCEENPEDCYWEMPEWRKQTNFIIPVGKKSISLPIGHLASIPNYIGQTIYAMGKYYISGGEKGQDALEAFKNITLGIGNAVDFTGQLHNVDFSSLEKGGYSLGAMAAGNFSPVINATANTNQFGGPIKPDNYDNRPEHLNFKEGKTPRLWVEIAKDISTLTGGHGGNPGKLEVNPNTLNFLMQSSFSGLYNFIEQSTKAASAVAKGEAPEINDIPVYNRFVRSSNMSVTKDKKAELIDKATKHILTDKESKQLHDYLDDLIEGGQDPEGKGKRSALRFVNKSQQQLKRNEVKYKE